VRKHLYLNTRTYSKRNFWMSPKNV